MMTMKWFSLVAVCASMPAFAAPEIYTVEPHHTYPSFETTHMGISLWRGKFDRTEGKIWLDRENKTGRVMISVDVRSINFGLPVMDKVALGDEFFKADQYPTAKYDGESITFQGDVPVAVNGELTLAGVTKPLKLQIASFKCIMSPFLKRQVCGADVRAEFDRRGFGMMRDIVPDDPNVRLYIQVEAIKGDVLPQLTPPTSAAGAAGTAGSDQSSGPGGTSQNAPQK
jgi:polyisoprenoid-binding protein YceI